MNINSALEQLEQYVTSNTGGTEGMQLLQQITVARIISSTTTTTSTIIVTDIQYIQALECGVFLSILQLHDIDLFTRNVHLLQPLYATYNQNHAATLPVVLPRQNHIIGLYLMSLLVTASSSEFHSELELLAATTTTQQQSNSNSNSNSTDTGNITSVTVLDDPYIQFPIALERQLMVGMYDEILLYNNTNNNNNTTSTTNTKKNSTLPNTNTYKYFMDQLVVLTIRDAIADGMEVSYQSLTLAQTAELMKLTNTSTTGSTNSNSKTNVPQELLDYIEESRNDWIINGDTILFQSASSSSQQSHTEMTTSSTTMTTITGHDVPSQQWIQQALTYATEMERII